jgi:hypothetical protein
LNKRSGFFVWLCVALSCTVLTLVGCGQNFYFAGRGLPPSGLTNRVLIAVQNPSPFAGGALVFVDAFYDIRHSYNNKIAGFSISGYSGSEPVSIQNIPEHQTGAVYNSGSGTFVLVDYGKETGNPALGGLAGVSSSIFITQNLQYVFAASQVAHVLTIIDRVAGANYYLNLPGIYRISVNPAGSVALAFLQNSDAVYSVVHLQSNQPAPSNAEDCEPQNLPVYCVVQVEDTKHSFDRPTKAIFSPDGSTAYVLNCGPECGGTQASVSFLPVAGNIIQNGTPVPPGADLSVQATIPIPGGARNALAEGNTLYVSGQQLLEDGLFSGQLTVLNTVTETISGQYGISDGDHGKMILADDSTLWIGSKLCQEGERYKLSQAGSPAALGCLTMFNTSTNAVMLDSYKGDATGLAAVTSLNKIYVAEGGQIHIYSTQDFHELDNTNVTVTGTAYDVAYMDGLSNGNNTTY